MASKTAIEERAKQEGCTASDLHRRLLAFALEKMPPGWGQVQMR
jgi:hypothetical protein